MAARNSSSPRRPAPIEPASAEELALTITRVFDAPAALVFKVWSSAEHMARWWGPKDFTCPHCKADFRPGGAWRACLRAPEGKDYWCAGTYREIVVAKRLIFTFAWEEDGERGRETLVTVTFEERAGKTQMTFHQTPFETAENRDSHVGGWNQCFDRLGAYLKVAA